MKRTRDETPDSVITVKRGTPTVRISMVAFPREAVTAVGSSMMNNWPEMMVIIERKRRVVEKFDMLGM